MIVNEMAGSGGDLMPWMFRHRKIGLLVGKRTWGGLVHTADTPPFIDGGSMIAPRGGFFTREGKWAVENEALRPTLKWKTGRKTSSPDGTRNWSAPSRKRCGC